MKKNRRFKKSALIRKFEAARKITPENLAEKVDPAAAALIDLRFSVEDFKDRIGAFTDFLAGLETDSEMAYAVINSGIRGLSLNAAFSSLALHDAVFNHLDFIEAYRSIFDWGMLSFRRDITIDFLRRFPDQVVWTNLLYDNKFNGKTIYECTDFVDEFQDWLDWSVLSMRQNITTEFIDRYISRIDFKALSYGGVLSEEMMDKYADRLNWREVVYWHALSKSVVDKHENDIDDPVIMKYSRKFSDRVMFQKACRNHLDHHDTKKKWKEIDE